MTRRAAALLVFAAALAALPREDAAAQARAPTRAERRAAAEREWRSSFLFYPMYDGLEGFSGYGYVALRRPAIRGPEPATAAVELGGGISTSGTRALQLAFDAPALWRPWRVLAIIGADRLQRAPYFGLGNAPYDSTPEAPRFYRYSLLRTTLFGAVQRTVAPHVRLVGGLQLRHYRALPLTGDPTLLAGDVAAGTVADTGAADGAEVRAGVLYDTRDEEASPSRGMFLEALVGRSATKLDYTRYAVGARWFVPLGEMTVLGLRQSLELASGEMPFYVMYERLTAWRPEDGFGGNTTLRAHLPGRFLAPNRAVVSADIRYKKLEVPIPTSPFRIWFLSFGDVGRLWLDGETPDLGGLHWDAGVGLFGQFSKGTIFGLNIGVSRIDGIEFGSAVSFGF